MHANLESSAGLAAGNGNLSLSVLTAIFQVNLGYLLFIEPKDDGSGGDH